MCELESLSFINPSLYALIAEEKGRLPSAVSAYKDTLKNKERIENENMKQAARNFCKLITYIETVIKKAVGEGKSCCKLFVPIMGDEADPITGSAITYELTNAPYGDDHKFWPKAYCSIFRYIICTPAYLHHIEEWLISSGYEIASTDTVFTISWGTESE